MLASRKFRRNELVMRYLRLTTGRGGDSHPWRDLWRSKRGKKGYCFMPCADLTDPDLAADFWIIRVVEGRADTRA